MTRGWLIALCLSACGAPPPAADISTRAPGPQLSHVELKRITPFQLPDRTARIDRVLTIHGEHFTGTSVGPWVYLDDLQAPGVEIIDAQTLRVFVPDGISGPTTIRVANPDGQIMETTQTL